MKKGRINKETTARLKSFQDNIQKILDEVEVAAKRRNLDGGPFSTRFFHIPSRDQEILIADIEREICVKFDGIFIAIARSLIENVVLSSGGQI